MGKIKIICDSMSDLTKCLYTYKSGDSTSLVVNRDGKEVKLNVAF